MRAARSFRLISVALALAMVGPAVAQPAPCPACARGDALIARFSLEPLRPIADQLVAIALADPVTPAQYTQLVELRQRTPALVRLGAIDDAGLGAIAASLCRAETGACFDATSRTLRCLADRCTVDLPPPDPRNVDVVKVPADCHQYSTHHRSSPFGLGFDWGNGVQRSRYPTDGGAWSLGIAGRMRFGPTLGMVARVDRIGGRDATTDVDGDGHDDVSTGTITRISALAGPTFVLDNTRFEDTTRFLRLDLLGGYVSTRSQANESGPAAGVDLAYQISVVRFGVRVVQGFGDARDATMLLAHLGFVAGSVPRYDDDTDCGAAVATRRSRLALGLEFPLGGYGFSSQLGYLAPSLGIEAAWHVTPMLDAVTHADLLVYPGGDRDRVLHHAVLTGLRLDHRRRGSSSPTGFFTTVMGGYSHNAGFSPTPVGSGPIIDLAFAWGGQASEGAAYLRLHARAGVGPDNLDYRAVFLSAGFEVRLDPRSWSDRD